MVRREYTDNWGIGKTFSQSKMFQFCQVRIPVSEALTLKFRVVEGLCVLLEKPPVPEQKNENGSIPTMKLKATLHLIEPGDGIFAVEGASCVSCTPEMVHNLMIEAAQELQNKIRGQAKEQDFYKSSRPIALTFLKINSPRLPAGTGPFRPSMALKKCSVPTCTKFNAGRGYCKAHGGGVRCKHPGCGASAKSIGFCKAHGGGKRCQYPECSKSAKEPTSFCYRHGGGSRCQHEKCSKIAMRPAIYCVSHGGGRKCSVEGCESASTQGKLCMKHGGGRRCKVENCTRVAKGRTGNCAIHGGGPRCSEEGCDKPALLRGQTIQDGPLRCYKHGGGKRCERENCNKLALGGKYCMSHGGGFRCEVEGCTTAARSGKRKRCWRHLANKKVCGVDNCITAAKRKGMCTKHYYERMPIQVLARSKQMLVSSERILENRQKVFDCTTCGKVFTQPGKFREHQLEEHLRGDTAAARALRDQLMQEPAGASEVPADVREAAQ